ncbi:transcriptional repressor LexA [Aestuariicoccus sp. MJ-SS9]|uniref:transcriptional repressor LexA n=1 Tax=Aestuariicoccus sp. MJ-SS9 TaxID=3079855 RepID=UPI002910C784|nr:transcriptional repressor LexA [Aestuariicoccus sp. MJ-SS9]MDU8911481.1 transcriptional repressor LexA [Aestuariicoccus sp. MJ-SS9]
MLTKKQLDLLDFINKRMTRDGVPPSFDEMKDALDLRSKSGIHRLITALEERGFIRRLAHRARAIEIVKLPDSLGGKPAGFVPQVIEGGAAVTTEPVGEAVADPYANQLPLLGRIAAGLPIEAINNPPPQIGVPPQMLSSQGRHYALEVKGDSMIDAGINDGDVVVIRETSSADTGDIVVAQADGYEATLKRFVRRDGKIVLEAANPAYKPMEFAPGTVTVQGKLVGLIRTY